MPEDANSKKRLGDFEVVRELGRGGMGIVYEARQVSLNRKVALKVISGSLGLSSKAVLRFQREAEAAGKLHHTNIVPIYSTGNDEGTHYYAMELIDGPSLHQVIRSLRTEDKGVQVSGSAATMAVGTEQVVSTGDSVLDSSSGAVETPAWVSEILGSPPVSGESTPAPRSNAGAASTSPPSSGGHLSSGYFDSVATMIAGVADALDYAHENGVIHRDIKPANLLLSRDGRVSVNDFGLARMLEQPGMTMSGEFVGSPLYMSPEQITAGRAPLDHRTDIYSLGATLYELLTLEPVFPGRSRDEVIVQILHKEPERPRRQNPKVPVDLETICLKAMEKDPDRRYQSAGQLADDLRRFVNRHAISARRVGPMERAVRWARKNKALTAMALLTLVVIVGAVVYVRSAERNNLCEKAKDEALECAMSGDLRGATEAIARAKEYGATEDWISMLTGQVDIFRGNSERAIEQLEIAVRLNPKSVMAHSLLTYAYGASALWEEYEGRVRELVPMPVATPRDKLLKGGAIFFFRTEECLALMDEAIRERPGDQFGRVLRARMRVFQSLEKANPSLIRDANAELDFASETLENNPVFLVTRLEARLAEYVFGGRTKETDLARELLDHASHDVKRLERHPQYLLGNLKILYFHAIRYEVSGAESCLNAMEQVMRASIEHGHTGFIVDPYASTMLRAGRNEEALKQLGRITNQGDPYVLFARILLLMETEEGRQEAEEILREYGDKLSVFAITASLFLGKKDEAIRRARRYIQSVEESAGFYNYDVALFQANSIGEEELLERAGTSQTKQATAYFSLGARKLADGDRDGALNSFKSAAYTLVYHWSPAAWARALAARMRKDLTWPDWR